MKNLSHIASILFNQPHLITPARFHAICHLLEAHLSGGTGRAATGITARSASRSTIKIDAIPGEPDGPVSPGTEDDDEQTVGSTAIIPVHGTLVMHPEDIAMSECGCSMENLSAAIDQAEDDPRITRVIYDFRTPGGTVTGIPETGRKILHSSKETIAFTNSECCSGGLWLASQCQHFYATGSSRVGSCGVYCMTLDMSKAMADDGISVNAIFAGKYKLLGASFKPLEDEERAILQKGVDKIYTQFKQAVENVRVVSDQHFGNGLVFDGEEAAEIGFIDGVVDSMDEILDNLVE